jgi:hypothetical protein
MSVPAIRTRQDTLRGLILLVLHTASLLYILRRPPHSSETVAAKWGLESLLRSLIIPVMIQLLVNFSLGAGMFDGSGAESNRRNIGEIG